MSGWTGAARTSSRRLRRLRDLGGWNGRAGRGRAAAPDGVRGAAAAEPVFFDAHVRELLAWTALLARAMPDQILRSAQALLHQGIGIVEIVM